MPHIAKVHQCIPGFIVGIIFFYRYAHVVSNNYTCVPNVGHTNKSPKKFQSKEGEHGRNI